MHSGQEQRKGKEKRFSLLSHAFIHLITSTWTHGFLFYSADFNCYLLMLKLIKFGQKEPLPDDSYILFVSSHPSLSSSFSSTKCSAFLFSFPQSIYVNNQIYIDTPILK
jgi:hypothetical protein